METILLIPEDEDRLDDALERLNATLDETVELIKKAQSAGDEGTADQAKAELKKLVSESDLRLCAQIRRKFAEAGIEL